MIDREKVIQWLGDEELFYRDKGDLHNSKKAYEALELLKEQEPIKPILERNSSFWAYYKCVACNEPVIYYQKYCSECGRKLEWK